MHLTRLVLHNMIAIGDPRAPGGRDTSFICSIRFRTVAAPSTFRRVSFNLRQVPLPPHFLHRVISIFPAYPQSLYRQPRFYRRSFVLHCRVYKNRATHVIVIRVITLSRRGEGGEREADSRKLRVFHHGSLSLEDPRRNIDRSRFHP